MRAFAQKKEGVCGGYLHFCTFYAFRFIILKGELWARNILSLLNMLYNYYRVRWGDE